MPSKKIAFVDTVHDVLRKGLEQLGWTCSDLTESTLQEIENQINDYQGIVIRSRFTLDKNFLSKATNLEFIARSGSGLENIDVDYCKHRNIQLFNSPEGNRNAVAEHAVGMLLALFNQLIKADTEVRSGKWDREGNRGLELEGKTVGIIGYGNNGSTFAKVLSGFGVEILAFDKYKRKFGNDRIQEVSLDEIFLRADIVSFHIPQNNETIGFLNDEFVSKMKKPFYVLNLSRGKIVSTAALLKALDSGKILGACLDVLEFEKPSFELSDEKKSGEYSPMKNLFSRKNVILSPHVAGWTEESYYKLSLVLLEKVKKHYSK